MKQILLVEIYIVKLYIYIYIRGVKSEILQWPIWLFYMQSEYMSNTYSVNELLLPFRQLQQTEEQN